MSGKLGIFVDSSSLACGSDWLALMWLRVAGFQLVCCKTVDSSNGRGLIIKI